MARVGKSGETWENGRRGGVVIGEYDYSIDAKGRLNFPAKFREEMGDKLIVTRWLEKCLVVFPESKWEHICEIVDGSSLVEGRDARRYLMARASDAAPDKQGRILIPARLRQHAGLEKDVTIIGQGSYAEIWDTAKWIEKDEELEGSDLAETIRSVGL